MRQRRFFSLVPSALCLLAAASAASAQPPGSGCQSCLCGSGLWRVDNCASIPRTAQPAPPGTYVNMWFGRQADAAEQDDFVIYRNMWFKGGTELGPMGRYYIDLISARLGRVPFPVVIETSHDDRIDDARRAVVLSLLEKRGWTDPTRVIVAYAIAEGLFAEESSRIAATYLNGGFGGLGGGTNFGFGGFSGLGSGIGFGR